MMRKAANPSFLVTTNVPGHHRPILTKQLKCQIAAVRETDGRGDRSSVGFWLTIPGCDKSAHDAPCCGPLRPRRSPILQQSMPGFVGSIKAAPTEGNILSEKGTPSATLAMAQGLATWQLLLTKQKQKCSQNAHEMILF
jgi:hypothetical protein